MFEIYVRETLWIYELFTEYKWLFGLFYFITTIVALSIFIFHEFQFKSEEFFLKNVKDLYDFSPSRYNLYKALIVSCLPLAMVIILWSLLERFNSRKFLYRFG